MDKASISKTNALRKARAYGWISVFRSALFLASLMVILEDHYVLEWLDVFMLRIVATFADYPNKEESVEVLVFTIQEELFEKEFQSRIPIHRAVLRKYLQKLDEAYRIPEFKNFKVLAIDYDLSPNNYDKECSIQDPVEQELQDALDTFLLNFIKNGVKVVLIKHIPVKNLALCECKIKWEEEKYKQGILFGHSELLHYGLLGPVVKYAESEDSFPAIVLDAANDRRLPVMRFTCDDAEQQARKDLRHASFYPINYVQVYNKRTVRVCELKDVNGFDDCKKYFENLDKPSNPDKLSVIFFGGDYGKDDTYITLLGTRPGVTIQAYTYFSMHERLTSEDGWAWREAWFPWLFDIIAGSFVGVIFHWIWHKFHQSRRNHKFTPQVIYASINFLMLIAILVFLVKKVAAPLLAGGRWINPALIVIGLFIHSYVATAITASEAQAPDSKKPHAVPLLYTLVGALFGIPKSLLGDEGKDRSPSTGDLLLHGALKIAVFWTVLGLAVYILVTHH